MVAIKPSEGSIAELVEGITKRSRRALAKVLTLVDNESSIASTILDKLDRLTGSAYIIGITGPAGAGKSTLVEEVTKVFRNRGQKVGIIAVDPTSPLTGGAILGDRIRMQSSGKDEGVFIRSVATRGAIGGLSSTCSDAIKVMDAYGKDIIIVETVGVGQDEVNVMKTADATILVLMPGGGDEVQMMKAGIMEIADIFVVNKADNPIAERVVQGIETILDLSNISRQWRPPVLKTVALESKGIVELTEAIDSFRTFQNAKNILKERRKERIRAEIASSVEKKIAIYVQEWLSEESPLEKDIDAIANKKIPPSALINSIIRDLTKSRAGRR